jgi:hypothetical protein
MCARSKMHAFNSMDPPEWYRTVDFLCPYPYLARFPHTSRPPSFLLVVQPHNILVLFFLKPPDYTWIKIKLQQQIPRNILRMYSFFPLFILKLLKNFVLSTFNLKILDKARFRIIFESGNLFLTWHPRSSYQLDFFREPVLKKSWVRTVIGNFKFDFSNTT